MSIAIATVSLVVFGICSIGDSIKKRNEPVVVMTTPTTTPAVQNAEPSADGIRFVFLNDINSGLVYIPVDESTARRHFLRPALPGYRMEFPKDNKLLLYKAPPVAGEPQELILSAEIPAGHGDKLLCILVNSPKGIYPVFVEDGDLEPGMVRIKNVTDTNYLLDIPTAPEGEEKIVLMEPGTIHTFGKTLVGNSPPVTFGVTMKHKLTHKGEETDWLTFRKFMLQSSPTKSFVRLFIQNGSSVMIHDIILFPEKPVPSKQKQSEQQ